MTKISVRSLVPLEREEWVRAVMQSFAAVASLTIATGVVFVPAEISRVQGQQKVYIRHCEPHRDPNTAVSLVRTFGGADYKGEVGQLVLHRSLGSQLEILDVLPAAPVACFTLSAHQRWLFVGDYQGSIQIVNLDVRPTLPITIGRHIHRFPSGLLCTNDSRTLISWDQDGLYAWDLATRKLRWCRLHPHLTCAVALPDSKSVLCGYAYDETNEEHGQVVELDVGSGALKRVVLPDRTWQEMAVSPDGQHLAVVASDGQARLYHPSRDGTCWSQRVIPDFRSGPHRVIPRFSPDSRRLVIESQASRGLAVWDLERGVCQATLVDGPFVAIGCQFLTRDNLAAWGLDGSFRVWDLRTGTRQSPGHLPLFELASDASARHHSLGRNAW